MKLITRDVKQLSPVEYQSCYNLNLGDHGLMRNRLVACRNQLTGTAVMLIEDDDQLLSWALVFPYDLNDDSYGAYFYTRNTCRRQGYGDKVAKEVKQQFPNVIVWPSNDRGKSFFNNYQFEQRLRYWVV
jgi:hypothetical protein